MSALDTLSSISANISSAYDALDIKGATMPSQKNINNLSATILNIPSWVGEDLTSNLLTNQITYLSDPYNKITKVRDYAFLSNTAIKKLSLPTCSYFGDYAFYVCSNLSSVYFPNVTYIGKQAFAACSIARISIPLCRFIGNSAFGAINAQLTSITFNPSLSFIGSYAFSGVGALTSITFMHSVGDSLTIGLSAFYSKTARSATIYHYGNTAVLNYNFSADKITPTFVDLRGT